ncbi:DNA polymerase III subunit alpha [Plantactinospora solaniradicis]|uniref:DNA-directed DNA polymerase n=1 Tax=Plantactinospora solaniradicis TaxID=1723736 RepID=A0ABW1KNT3_9ACTN
MPDEFAHLHVHGEKSITDGAGKFREYADRAARLGMPALAGTDHGNANDGRTLWEECNRVGVKPIIGSEIYLTPGTDRRDRTRVRWADGGEADVSGGGAYTHLTVLAGGPDGLRDLFELQHLSYTEGFYSKPRVDRDLLRMYGQDLIILSGCVGGELGTRLRLGQLDEADETAAWFAETFRGRYWIEVMSHGNPWETDLNEQLIALAKRHGLGTVLTNDVHYLDTLSAPTHRAMLCVQTQSTLARPAMSFGDGNYSLRPAREMDSLGLPKESSRNTLVVAEQIGSYDEVFEEGLQFPVARLPDEFEFAEDYLHARANAGLIQRRQGFPTEQDRRQLQYELETICNIPGAADYLLVEADIIEAVKAEGILVGPGRGSAGGSLVVYALGITDLDPVAHGGIFERFMNPNRLGMPDIDIDVQDDKRDRVIEIIRELYGDNNVVQFGTYLTFGAKGALGAAARVHGKTFEQGQAYARQLPEPKAGRPVDLADYTGLRDEVYDTAEGLFGRIRGQGVHPAAVGIAPPGYRVERSIPLRRPGGVGPLVTGYVDHVMEEYLVKYDFLGLRNLTIVANTLKFLKQRGVALTLPLLPGECNDRKTYEQLSEGYSLGCFQLDGTQMRRLLRRLKPSEFGDILALLALFRPGPMGADADDYYADRKNTNGGVWSDDWAIHPELGEALRPALEETYGLIVFQEQVLQVLNIICGWSYAEAALLFDAMRKKNIEKMDATRPNYEAAGLRRGYSAESLTALWEVLVPFADYSFNKAHSAGYGLVAYWTAYLKANHPVEYMAATLTSVSDDQDRLPEYLAECARMGLRILPPSINGGFGFSPGDGGIHYGLGAIKGVGASVYAGIEETRGTRPFSSLRDFFSRVDQRALSLGTLKALVASGALDTLCPRREELYVQQTELAARAIRWRAESAFGQRSLLEPTFPVWPRGMYSTTTRREWEQQYLGVALTTQPIELGTTRRVTQEELEWLRNVLSRNPGDSPVWLLIGGRKMSLPSANWPAIEAAIESVGIFDVSAP